MWVVGVDAAAVVLGAVALTLAAVGVLRRARSLLRSLGEAARHLPRT